MNSVTKKILWIGAGLIGGAALLVLFWFDPARVPIYPQCVFHQMTGLDCPGCGGLRCVHALLHGNVTGAIRFNAFFVLCLPVLGLLALDALWRKFERRPARKIRSVWIWGFFAAYILFGIVRDLPVPHLASLAP